MFRRSAPSCRTRMRRIEYLFSDEAQLALVGGPLSPDPDCRSQAAWNDPLEKFDGAQPTDPDGYQDVDPVFPTLKEQERARDIITNGWDAVVGVKIRCVPQEDELIPMSFSDTTTCEGPFFNSSPELVHPRRLTPSFASQAVAVAIKPVNIVANHAHRPLNVGRSIATAGCAVNIRGDRHARIVVRIAIGRHRMDCRGDRGDKCDDKVFQCGFPF